MDAKLTNSNSEYVYPFVEENGMDVADEQSAIIDLRSSLKSIQVMVILILNISAWISCIFAWFYLNDQTVCILQIIVSVIWILLNCCCNHKHNENM